jgi:hypothetical protein
VHAAALTARKEYKRLLSRKRYSYKQQLQVQHLQTFFSKHSGQFWKAFLGKRDAMCPITDVHEWTDWFRGIMGEPAPIQAIMDGDMLNTAVSLRERHTVPVEDMATLNDPFTLDEVIEVLQALPLGKAADAQGLTCELLRLATVRVPAVDGTADGEREYVCEPLVACFLLLDSHHSESDTGGITTCRATSQQAHTCAQGRPSSGSA